MTCPHCRNDARCKGFRPRTLVCLLGTLRLSRHYYHCKHCRRGSAPLDATLRLQGHDLTPAAEEVTCLGAALASYALCATTSLPKMSGLRLSESTVERVAEAAGRRVAQALDSGQTFGAAADWPWHRDAEGQTVAYVSIDATGVGMQGPDGSAAPGRMAYVGMVYNPVPQDRQQWANPRGKRPDWQACYVSRLRPLAELSEPMRRLGGQAGMDSADRWIALSDGGSGLEDFLAENFPRVEEVILDFYHVTEYLGDLAKAYSGGDEGLAERLSGQWCQQLKHQGGAAVLERLRQLDVRGKGGAVREKLREVLVYLENQRHRTDYPRYLSQGWQIGSGPVESGCKRVVGGRLKGGGMRWGEDGADGMCHLRALLLSEPQQWQAFFSPN